MKLAEGQRPAKQGTQLEINEEPLDREKRVAAGFVQLEAVDLQAQDERIDGDFPQTQFNPQVVPDRARRRVID